MYAIRGIYFNKKADYITNKKNNSGSKIQKSVLKISDIYELFYSVANLIISSLYSF